MGRKGIIESRLVVVLIVVCVVSRVYGTSCQALLSHFIGCIACCLSQCVVFICRVTDIVRFGCTAAVCFCD